MYIDEKSIVYYSVEQPMPTHPPCASRNPHRRLQEKVDVM